MTETTARAAWGDGLATLDAVGRRARRVVPGSGARRAAGRRERPRRAGRRWPRPTTYAASPARCAGSRSPTSSAAPASTEDVWLRLHLLSHRLVRPHGDLDGRRLRPAHQRRVDLRRPVRGRRLRADPGAAARRRGQHVTVFGVDKFPRMIDYVVPERRPHRRRRPGPARRPPRRGHHRHARGLRQLQRRHARHLHGRGPDLGGRRGRRRLRRRRRRVDHGHPLGRRQGRSSRIGERCLLGANAGIGISLGDDCVVEAGCYVTAGTKVTVKRHGRQAAGRQGGRALRASTTCCSAATRSPARSRPCRGRATGIALNAALHAN